MKTRGTILVIGWLVLAVICLGSSATLAAETNVIHEYATLRWDGRDNTHVIYPGGHVEILAANFKTIKKPERADERSFFMNLAMNALARQGYELVAMTGDDYVFRRPVKP
jgi:hypothetical protein